MQTRWTQWGNGSIEYHTHSIIGGTPTPDVRLVFARDYFLISQIQSRLVFTTLNGGFSTNQRNRKHLET